MKSTTQLASLEALLASFMSVDVDDCDQAFFEGVSSKWCGVSTSVVQLEDTRNRLTAGLLRLADVVATHVFKEVVSADALESVASIGLKVGQLLGTHGPGGMTFAGNVKICKAMLDGCVEVCVFKRALQSVTSSGETAADQVAQDKDLHKITALQQSLHSINTSDAFGQLEDEEIDAYNGIGPASFDERWTAFKTTGERTLGMMLTIIESESKASLTEAVTNFKKLNCGTRDSGSWKVDLADSASLADLFAKASESLTSEGFSSDFDEAFLAVEQAGLTSISFSRLSFCC
jgi:hypothetical protein